MNLQEFLEHLKQICIVPTEKQLEQLEKYYEILVEWNKFMNLTGIIEKEQVYLKHFYDSASLVISTDFSKIETLCDVGTGAGFPGMVLKILFPNIKVILVDSLQKRIQFLNHVISELGLNQIETYHARAEEFAHTHKEMYDIVTARAVAPLPQLIEYCVPMVKVGKYFIPMKANINEELEISKHAMKELELKMIGKHEFLLPKEDSHRAIIVFQKQRENKKKYPRKYSDIKKRPL